MSRVRVYRSNFDGIDEDALRTLLEQAECEIAEDDLEEFTRLVILTESLLDDPDLSDALLQGTAAGHKIIGIWSDGNDAGELPSAVRDYAFDRIVWNPEILKKVLCGEAEPALQEPDGTPSLEPETPRNKC